MLQILLVILWLFIIPFGCGLAVSKYMPQEKQKADIIWISGYLVAIALFHCFYLGFVLFGSTSFKWLCLIFGIFICIFSVISYCLRRKMICKCFEGMKNKEALGGKIIFIVIVTAQIVMRLFQQISDGDDAFYIATATAAWGSNTMNLIQPYTGFITPNLDVRHAFSSAPIWLAFLSKVTMVHPAIMAHSILAPVLIILHYIVILNIGNTLFKEKKNATYVFASLIGLFNVYGFVSIYTAQTFFLTRTWQGKSIFANIFLPVLFLILLWISEQKKEEKEKNIYYVSAMISIFGATAMTTMATFVMPLLFMIGITFLAIVFKKPRLLWKGMLACLPAVMLAIIFLVK